VFDEAQILTEKALEDMVAATNQSRHPHGALLFYIGTPPRAVDPGEVFTNKRAKALKGTSRDTFYLEFSADPDADPDDVDQWRKANPSYPHRTPHESMLRLRENVGTDKGWLLEGLGIWDTDEAATIFGADWRECRSTNAPAAPSALALAVSPNGSAACIAAASLDGEVDHGDGTGWIVRTARERHAEFNLPLTIDGKGPGSFLVEPLQQAGVALHIVNLGEFIDACEQMHAGVTEEPRTIAHRGEALLDEAVRSAGWRTVGERRAFKRRSGDITPLEACALAAYTAKNITRHPANNVW
jgi:hypothetical protein